MLYQKNQPERDQLIKDLNDLKTLFVEKGWIKHRLSTESGFCTIGGVLEVTQGTVNWNQTPVKPEELKLEANQRYWRVIAALARASGLVNETTVTHAVSALISRNDNLTTTMTHTLNTIDKAIEQCMIPVFAEVD